MIIARHVPLLLLGLALSACEGALSVDLQADPPGLGRQLTLVVDQLTLRTEDGVEQSFDLERSISIGDSGLSPITLLDNEDLADGRYTSATLRFRAEGSRLRERDGSERDINLTRSTATADRFQVRVREDETASLTLHLVSFASLPRDPDGAQNLTPRISGAASDDLRAFSVSLNADSALDIYCQNRQDDEPRLYLFANDAAPLDDLDGGTDDALRVVSARRSSSTSGARSWALSRVPTGTYRIALSCDADDPASDDVVRFFCPATTTIDADSSVVLQDISSASDCN